MPRPRHFVLTYDIVSSKRRRRLAARLRPFGVRVQKSVFEVWLTAAHQGELRSIIEQTIEPEEDDVRLYLLGAASTKPVAMFGVSVDVQFGGCQIM